MHSLVRILAVCTALAPVYAQYGGPAVLSRGQAPTGMNSSQIDFRPFVSVDVGYSTGLNGVSIDANGKQVNVSSGNVSAAGGVSGTHSWKHTTLGLDYHISFAHQFAQSYYDSINQILLLSLNHMISRHVQFALRENAGYSSGLNQAPVLQQTIAFDPSTSYVPTNEFFDNRTLYVSTQADLQIQRSTRLSFDLGVDGFITRRRSTALYGVTGEGARGDLQYRLSRRATLGAMYSFTHYSFTDIFSSTDIHSLAATYSIQLSPTVEFSGFGGISRFENKTERTVPIDPVIAAIIGIGSARQVSYTLDHIPNFSGRISKIIPRGVLAFSAGEAITPGNGLFLTSKSTSIVGSYSYTGLKRWGLSAGTSYTNSGSVGNVVGNYTNLSMNVSASRQIYTATHGVLSFSVNKYGSGDFKNYNMWSYNFHVGLGFTPGDVPIRLW